MPDKPIPPNDQIPPIGPQGAPRAPEPSFTLIKMKAIQKPALEEELVDPPGGGSSPPCSCNAVCACVPVQQCSCDNVCPCNLVESCPGYSCSHSSGCWPIHWIYI
jgi:hypothetical protein